MRDIHGNMGAARLVASRSGWFPNPTQPVAGEEWLQVPLPDWLSVICRWKAEAAEATDQPVLLNIRNEKNHVL